MLWAVAGIVVGTAAVLVWVGYEPPRGDGDQKGRRREIVRKVGTGLVIAVVAVVLVVFVVRVWPRAATDVLAEVIECHVCRDGSLSLSQNRQGTCSWHNGVEAWADTVSDRIIEALEPAANA